MKKLTLDRVLPTISPSVSGLILRITVWDTLTKVSKQEQNPSQSLFTGIEKLINQIFFVSNIPSQETGYEQVREPVLRLCRGIDGDHAD